MVGATCDKDDKTLVILTFNIDSFY